MRPRRAGPGRLTRRAVLSGAAGAGLLALPASAQRGINALPTGSAPVVAPVNGGRASPDAAPVLMPGTAMHVGPIRALCVSSDGTVVATGSADRSIRLWSAAKAEPLLRLSLPLGEGSVGVVDALVLSRDSTRLYAAGVDWAAPAGSSQGMVYVFDLTTGQLTGLMAWPAGFGSRLRSLVLSPSGGQMAIAAGQNGLIVRDTAGPAFALRYSEPPNPARSLSAVGYSPDGSLLAAASAGGVLRLFAVGADGGVREGTTRTLPGGGEANTLSFSADGALLAIGYLDRPVVHVVPVRGGGPIVSLEPPAGASRGNLAAVAWGRGPDGQVFLYAGGTSVDQAGRNLLLAWRDGRPGAPLAAAVAQDSLTQMVAHPEAGVLFASSDPRWGWVMPATDRAGLRGVHLLDTERLDLRGVPGRVWGIDPAGKIVEFQGAGKDMAPLRFDLNELTLTVAAFRALDMSRPRPVNGSAPPGLPRGTVLRAMDAGPGGVVAGTDDYLLLYDGAGRAMARRQVATAVWGLAVARGARVVVAAHGDGTLRWYSLEPDRLLTELGGLFVAADQRRWLAWRADGRFAHSAGGGAALVGFQQNGSFVPGRVSDGGLTGRWLEIDQLYRRLYDPDQVRSMLTADAAALGGAPKEIGELKLPSVKVQGLCPAEDVPARARGIRVLADAPVEETTGRPGDAKAPVAADAGCRKVDTAALRPEDVIELPPGTTAMKVQLSLDGQGRPTQVSAFVNEQSVGRTLVRPETRSAGGPVLVEQLVPLGPGMSRVEFRAATSGQADFTRAPTILRVSVGRVGLGPATVARPTLRALVVGVNAYSGIQPLRFARADAESFATAIGQRGAREYAQPVVTTLLDQEATLERVTAALAEIATDAVSQDAVVIYFAGHGVVGTADRSYAFITADVRDADAALRGGQGMGAERLARGLSEVRAERVFVFLDTCYAGAFDPRTIGYLNHDTGRYVLAASTRLEEALDGYDGRNGLFAYAVKEALGGKVGQAGRSVDAFDLGRYVTTRVEELAQTRSWQQRAVFQAAGRISAFPLVAPA